MLNRSGRVVRSNVISMSPCKWQQNLVNTLCSSCLISFCSDLRLVLCLSMPFCLIQIWLARPSGPPTLNETNLEAETIESTMFSHIDIIKHRTHRLFASFWAWLSSFRSACSFFQLYAWCALFILVYRVRYVCAISKSYSIIASRAILVVSCMWEQRLATIVGLHIV